MAPKIIDQLTLEEAQGAVNRRLIFIASIQNKTGTTELFGSMKGYFTVKRNDDKIFEGKSLTEAVKIFNKSY